MKTDDRKGKAVESSVYAEAMAETIRESIVILDEDLRIISANRAFLETFRVTRHEIENRLLGEFGGGEWDIPALLASLKKVFRQKTELKNYEIGHDFPGVGQKFLVLNARPIPSHDGAGRWMLLAIEDRTEELRTIEDLRKQTELLQLAHDAILVRDVDSVILFWNRGAQETYGWSAAEACGNISHQLLSTKFPDPFDHWQEKLLSRGSWEGELVHMTKDGKRIHVASRQVLQHDQTGRMIGILEINRDITSRKDAEEALRNLSGRLLQLQDEERRRIARELHDSTGQSLAALVIHLSAVSARISEIDAAAAEMLHEAIDLSQKASDETRTLSYLLYPPDPRSRRTEVCIRVVHRRIHTAKQGQGRVGRFNWPRAACRNRGANTFPSRTGEPHKYIPPLGKRYRERAHQPAAGNCSFGSGRQWQGNPGRRAGGTEQQRRATGRGYSGDEGAHQATGRLVASYVPARRHNDYIEPPN